MQEAAVGPFVQIAIRFSFIPNKWRRENYIFTYMEEERGDETELQELEMTKIIKSNSLLRMGIQIQNSE